MVFDIVNSGFYEGEQNAIGVGGGGSLFQMKAVPIGKGSKASLGTDFIK